MEDVIKKFLSVGDGYCSGSGSGSGYGDGSGSVSGSGSGSGSVYGDGDGSGSGYGYGDGDGYGNGSGSGYGDGDGDGYGYGNGYGSVSGYGDGYGNGYGIKSHNGKTVYIIDSVLTIIDSVRRNIAKGFILNDDLTLEPCFVVKQDDLFAHGETLHKAQEALQDKLFEEYDEETRIEKFKEEFPDPKKKYPAKQFFIWHNKLTGSCEQGRKNFCQSKQIDIEKDEFTVAEFVRITKESYRGDVISKIVNHQI